MGSKTKTEKRRGRPPLGRPDGLTPELRDEFVRHLLVGNYIETACSLCRINKQSVYAWLRRGHDQKRGKYRDFLNAVKEAQAKAESRGLLLIEKAANGGQWQAAAWRLERKFPKRWGRQGAREKPTIEPGQLDAYVSQRLLELSQSTQPAVALAATKALAEYPGSQRPQGEGDARELSDGQLDALLQVSRLLQEGINPQTLLAALSSLDKPQVGGDSDQ